MNDKKDKKKKDSPNGAIDRRIQQVLLQVDTNDIPVETKLKAIQVAIQWEKVKHHIIESGDNDGLDSTIFGDTTSIGG